jgi:predicted Rossmann fold nucleotide-binding protein DprA/Smf involved in DNA uptake
MFGMDFFLKSATTSMKIAQQGMENMFKMMGFFLGLSSQTKKPAEKEDPVAEKPKETTETPSAVKEQIQVSEKTAKVPKDLIKQSIENSSPSEPAPVSSQQRTSSKSKAKKEIKPAASQKQLQPKKKMPTAIDEVQAFMSRRKQGASTEDIMKSTGYNKKKVQDILYKLKNRGILKVEKGLYFLT